MLPGKNNHEYQEFPAKKRVSFSSTNKVHLYETDLKHDDIEFLRIARIIIGISEGKMDRETSKMKKFYKWMVNQEEEELDSLTMNRFKEAFKYRLGQLPEFRTECSMDIEKTLRRLLGVIHSSGGWYSLQRDTCQCESKPNIERGGEMLDKVRVSISADELSWNVRNLLARDMSVETISRSILHLTKIKEVAEDEDVIEFCRKEIITLRGILEDMGLPYSEE